MDKRSAALAHERITKVETLQEERWKETIERIKRLESILIGSAGATIILLLTMLYKT